MTEAEAWNEIGMAYLAARKTPWQCKLTRAGICAAIYVLFDHAEIDTGTINMMKSKAVADKDVHTKSFPYRWPCSPKANKQRALFCFARERECNGQA